MNSFFSTTNYTKKRISNNLKKKVWKRQCRIDFPFLCQCYTCENLLRVPESIRKSLFKNISFDILKSYPNGEFGHVISEKNGGLTTSDNLIVQCKDCNLLFSSRNIDLENDKSDIVMLNVNFDPLKKKCKHWSNYTNRYCKNKSKNGYDYCTQHIHLHYS